MTPWAGPAMSSFSTRPYLHSSQGSKSCSVTCLRRVLLSHPVKTTDESIIDDSTTVSSGNEPVAELSPAVSTQPLS